MGLSLAIFVVVHHLQQKREAAGKHGLRPPNRWTWKCTSFLVLTIDWRYQTLSHSATPTLPCCKRSRWNLSFFVPLPPLNYSSPLQTSSSFRSIEFFKRAAVYEESIEPQHFLGFWPGWCWERYLWSGPFMMQILQFFQRLTYWLGMGTAWQNTDNLLFTYLRGDGTLPSEKERCLPSDN